MSTHSQALNQSLWYSSGSWASWLSNWRRSDLGSWRDQSTIHNTNSHNMRTETIAGSSTWNQRMWSSWGQATWDKNWLWCSRMVAWHIWTMAKCRHSYTCIDPGLSFDPLPNIRLKIFSLWDPFCQNEVKKNLKTQK